MSSHGQTEHSPHGGVVGPGRFASEGGPKASYAALAATAMYPPNALQTGAVDLTFANLGGAPRKRGSFGVGTNLAAS